MELYEKDLWTNPGITSIFGGEIIEYDIESAGYNLIIKYKLLPEEDIKSLTGLKKDKLVVKIGNMQRKNPEFAKRLAEAFVEIRRLFFESNGIATVDVVISCTSSDSLNAVVANIAKNVYHVPIVIARMYNPIRARMFEAMGIYTVSITRLGLDNVIEYLEGIKSWRVVRKLGNDVQLVRARVPASLEGTPFSALDVDGKIKLIAVERQGYSFVPKPDDFCEYNDIIHLSVGTDYLEQARDLLQL